MVLENWTAKHRPPPRAQEPAPHILCSSIYSSLSLFSLYYCFQDRQGQRALSPAPQINSLSKDRGGQCVCVCVRAAIVRSACPFWSNFWRLYECVFHCWVNPEHHDPVYRGHPSCPALCRCIPIKPSRTHSHLLGTRTNWLFLFCFNIKMFLCKAAVIIMTKNNLLY